MRIRRTKKIDRRGLIRKSRQVGIAKMFTDNLIRGNVVELSDDKAEVLIEGGYAVNAGGRAVVDDTTVDDRDITTTETVETIKTVAEDTDDEELDSEDDEDVDPEDDDRDIEL